MDDLFFIKWDYRCVGDRCFIVTAEDDTVCEVIAPNRGDPEPVARKIVRDHNDALMRIFW